MNAKIIGSVLVVFGLFIGGKVKAESHVGNGGIAVVCYVNGTSQVKSIELLEYLEGLVLWRLSFNQVFNSSNPQSLILNRLNEVSPVRAKLYTHYLKQFPVEASFRSGIDIVDPDDTQNYINRKGCKHKTIVLQSAFDIPGLPKYIVNKDLFDQMHPQMQLMTVFHEIIYREALSYGHTTSQFTRSFNALLFSDQWGAESHKELKLLFRIHKFPRDAKGADL